MARNGGLLPGLKQRYRYWTARLRGLRYHIDHLSPDGIAGWAFVRSTPELRPEVEVRCGPLVLASGSADRPRPDLQAARMGDGAYGFFLTPNTTDLPDPRVEVYIQGLLVAREPLPPQALVPAVQSLPPDAAVPPPHSAASDPSEAGDPSPAAEAQPDSRDGDAAVADEAAEALLHAPVAYSGDEIGLVAARLRRAAALPH